MPALPYTPIRRAGEWLICSGQLGMRDGALVDGGVRAQARQAIANLRALLEGEGASLADVVKTTVFLAHISDFPLVNETYAAEFASADPLPARSTFAVAALPLGGLVEIEAWAYHPA
jgi:2-iminobutanoate/2-iminopropanoate deaminase